jgi:type II secretion system protein G
MGSFEQTEPITLDYASARDTRRFTPLEKTLLAFAGVFASFFLIVFMQPSFGSHPAANVDLTKAIMGSLTSPLELFHQAMGRYPTELKELYDKPAGEAEASKWAGPYLDSPYKLQDAWGREFRYKSPGVNNSQQYDLWSMGKDGEDATDDDIRNWVADNP